ncbi:unnamed protein product, partial [marine sediment metagenome]
SYITTCQMGGGVFIASKLAVLLLRRNSLIPQLTSEERACEIKKGGKIREAFQPKSGNNSQDMM